MTITVCLAARHDTWWAYRRHQCACPAARQAHRRKVREDNARREYIPGRISNRRGPRADQHVDQVAVDLAVGGDRAVRLTLAERRAAIDLLDQLGMSAAEIAIRLGMTVRTVQRQRARRRTGAPR